VTHKLHEKQTTVNAYIVYSSAAEARAALKLNGSTILDRHIRVDSVAHPAPHDAKRCVFIGNLDFEAQEESLWRHFEKCGKVESVRIVRDAKTNVGKGFAYVQFEVLHRLCLFEPF
jgi:nucleolar protein 12